jgi:hypothetical protein
MSIAFVVGRFGYRVFQYSCFVMPMGTDFKDFDALSLNAE